MTVGYLVTDRDGKEVKPGDLITDFRGATAIFVKVSRGPEYNGTAKVIVSSQAGEPEYVGREYYVGVFGLTVTPEQQVV